MGEKLSDYPDYYRVLPASDGSSVALSKFLDKSPVMPHDTLIACRMQRSHTRLVCQHSAAVD